MERLFKDLEVSYGKANADKCRDVTSVVRAKVIAANYFGWRSFVDDMLIDLVTYMINDSFAHSAGAYVACGMQSAIDHCRYCNAAKRRGDYELVSLDEFFQVEDVEDDEDREFRSLILDISIKWGDKLANELEGYAKGAVAKLSKAVQKVIKSPEFVEWLKQATGRDC